MTIKQEHSNLSNVTASDKKVNRQEFEAFLENRGIGKHTSQYEQAMRFFEAASQGKLNEFTENVVNKQPLDASKAYDFSHLVGTTIPSFNFDDMCLLRGSSISETEFLAYLKFYKVPSKTPGFEAAVSWYNLARGGNSGRAVSREFYKKCPPSEHLLSLFGKPNQSDVKQSPIIQNHTEPTAHELSQQDIKSAAQQSGFGKPISKVPNKSIGSVTGSLTQQEVRKSNVLDVRNANLQSPTEGNGILSQNQTQWQLHEHLDVVARQSRLKSPEGLSGNQLPQLSFANDLVPEFSIDEIKISSPGQSREEIVLASLVMQKSNVNAYASFLEPHKAKTLSKNIENLIDGLDEKRTLDVPQIKDWLQKRGFSAQSFFVNKEFCWGKAIKIFASTEGLFGQHEVLTMMQYAASHVDTTPFQKGLGALLEKIVVLGRVSPATVVFFLGESDDELNDFLYKDSILFGVSRVLEKDFWAEQIPSKREQIVLYALEDGKIDLAQASAMLAFATWQTSGHIVAISA